MAFSAAVRESPVAEMNITPLVDVMLVLLVIFMVSAPLLSQPLRATLPQEAPPAPLKPLQLQVEVLSDGAYRLDGRPLGPEQLWHRLDEAVITDPNAVLRISSASDADYQPMVTVLAQARARGISHIGVQP